jgi:hypothetical protein
MNAYITEHSLYTVWEVKPFQTLLIVHIYTGNLTTFPFVNDKEKQRPEQFLDKVDRMHGI